MKARPTGPFSSKWSARGGLSGLCLLGAAWHFSVDSWWPRWPPCRLVGSLALLFFLLGGATMVNSLPE